MVKHIGIIVMNYDENIFVCKDGYFIKATVGENNTVEERIKNEIKYYLDRDMFRIVKVFDEKLMDGEELRTMYLVEVGIYTKEFEFKSADKIVNEIVNINYKEYLQNNLIRYDKNNSLASTIVNLFVMIIAMDVIPKLIIKNETVMFLPLLGFIGVLYLLGTVVVKPKLINGLLKIKINTTIAITTMNIITTLYWVRLFLLVR
ncbi:MAG: hypothetical protein ACRC92_01095 [Peptostreptococcaceae bacterium]